MISPEQRYSIKEHLYRSAESIRDSSREKMSILSPFVVLAVSIPYAVVSIDNAGTAFHLAPHIIEVGKVLTAMSDVTVVGHVLGRFREGRRTIPWSTAVGPWLSRGIDRVADRL